jgi:hypothetical protein
MKQAAMIAGLICMPVLFIACGRDNDMSAPKLNGTAATAGEALLCPADDGLVSKVSMSAVNLAKTVPNTEYFSREGCTPAGSPECATVAIPVNGIVKWTDDITDPDPYWWWQIISSDGSWVTPPVVKPGNSVCMQFTVPGTYEYHCAEWVKGTVVVQ